MHPLECCLTELRDIRTTGAAVNELSFYAPLPNLLNEVDKALRRDLTVKEGLYATEMARRLASLVLWQPKFDANDHAVFSEMYPWLGVV